MDFQLPPIIIHRRLSALTVGQEIPYHIADYKFLQMWEHTKAGKGIKICVCDTGFPKEHAASGDLIGAIFDAKDFTGSKFGVNDIHGHSTHVCGIIAANNNDKGIPGGAYNAQICTAKVLGDDGSGSDKSVADGIKWGAEKGCQLINCSLGSQFPSQTILDACQYAASKNCLVICASGNEGPGKNTVGFPAGFDDVAIAVGAVDENKNIANFSSRGMSVDLACPGVRIKSTYLNGQYAELSGTSMATPWFVSLVANRLAYERISGATQVTDIKTLIELLSKTSEEAGEAGKDYEFGYGIPIPLEFYKHGIGGSPTPVPPPVQTDTYLDGFKDGVKGSYVFRPHSQGDATIGIIDSATP